MIRFIEMCVRLGKTLVIQNVGETIDTILVNLLNNNIEKCGNI